MGQEEELGPSPLPIYPFAVSSEVREEGRKMERRGEVKERIPPDPIPHGCPLSCREAPARWTWDIPLVLKRIRGDLRVQRGPKVMVAALPDPCIGLKDAPVQWGLVGRGREGERSVGGRNMEWGAPGGGEAVLGRGGRAGASADRLPLNHTAA